MERYSTMYTTMIGRIEASIFNRKFSKDTFLHNVRYVHNFGDTSLLSIGTLTGRGYDIHYTGNKVEISSKTTGVILVGREVGNIYKMSIKRNYDSDH